MELTREEHARVMERRGFALLRPSEQWEQIFAGMTAEEAAARILGELYCYSGERHTKDGGWERRRGFLGDVAQLANALTAFPRSNPGKD